MFRAIALGAGVQSSVLALMAAHDEIDPMPDCAINSDTVAESKATYAYIDWLRSPNVLPFPVHMVSAGSLEEQTLQSLAGNAPNHVPWFTRTEDGDGMLWRSCTDKFKIVPMRKKLRELVGLKPGQRCEEPLVEIWFGITTDEASRMKMSSNKWSVHRYPLIEAGMSRWDCLRWLERHGYPEPPKSACWFCPYADDARWRDLRDNHPEEWEKAVALDHKLRSGVRNSTGVQYMHRSFKPLGEVDLSTAEDRGQLNLFNNECDGMCGV